MIVVENQRVCELFETQTYCLHVYPCLYEQIMTIINDLTKILVTNSKVQKPFPWYC